jgi:UDP-glucose 4-epimerase
MKTILLIGGYGFIGTNIIKYIDEYLVHKYEVIVFDQYIEHVHYVRFKSIIKSYAGDFSDTILMESVFAEKKIDIVIHSLSTTVPVSSFNARFDIESNLVPTVELLNCMIKYGVKNIVYISSGGAIYGNSLSYRHKETDNVTPISSYGVVKLAIEKYLLQYAILYGMQPLIIRPSNPYGPYHYSSKQGICNIALHAALQHQPFTVWGNGKAQKDYIYVKDFVDILFTLLQKNVYNRIINVGSGQIVSVNEILALIRAFVPDFTWHYTDASRFDVFHFELDTSALMDLIGNYPFVKLQEGLLKAKNWQQNENQRS